MKDYSKTPLYERHKVNFDAIARDEAGLLKEFPGGCYVLYQHGARIATGVDKDELKKLSKSYTGKGDVLLLDVGIPDLETRIELRKPYPRQISDL